MVEAAEPFGETARRARPIGVHRDVDALGHGEGVGVAAGRLEGAAEERDLLGELRGGQ